MNPRYSLKTPSLRLCNLFYKMNFDTGLEIRFVSTMNISSYTQYEQPRVAEKQFTILAKNGMAAVTYSNHASRVSKFLVGSITAAAVVE